MNPRGIILTGFVFLGFSASAEAAGGFNSTLRLRVYERGKDDRPDRLIGTTPLPKNKALRVPPGGNWYVEPRSRLTPQLMKRLHAEIVRRKIPGLDLSGHSEVNDETLKSLTAHPQLRTLLLARTNVTDKGLAHLKAFPRLRVLSVGEGVTVAGVQSINRLQSLHDLDLSDTRLDAKALAQLKPFLRLRRFTPPEHTWSVAGAQAVARSAKVEYVMVAGPVSPEVLRALKPLRALRGIDLQRAELRRYALEGLKGFPNLEVIYLPPDFTAREIGTLASLPKLQTLDLTGAQISPPIVRRLGKLTNLRALALTDSTITPEDLASLKPLRSLTLLELSGTLLPTGSLKPIGSLKHLKVLSLPEMELADVDRTTLHRMKSLQVVAVGGQPIALASLAPPKPAPVSPPTPLPVPKPKQLPVPTPPRTLPLTPVNPTPTPVPMRVAKKAVDTGAVYTDKRRPGLWGSPRTEEPLSPAEEMSGTETPTPATTVVSTESAPTPSVKPTKNIELAGLTGIQRLRVLSQANNTIDDIVPAGQTEIRQFEETSENSLGEFTVESK